jgi:hypothetical protein
MWLLRLIRRYPKVAVFAANIVVLAIFWPFGPKPFSRERGDCMGNLQKYSTGMSMYLTDNDDRFPDRDQWMTALAPYTPGGGNLYCPTVADIPGAYGYAMNSDLSRRPLDTIPNSTTPAVYDSINMGLNASDGLKSLPYPSRHGRKNIALTVGGSVVQLDPMPPPASGGQ